MLAGGTSFTKLDLHQAYQQILMDEDSVKYHTINTSRGLFQFTRLPYQAASAPALLQHIMDTSGGSRVRAEGARASPLPPASIYA